MGLGVDIAVWRLDGDAEAAEALLSDEERARAARFLRPQDRARYMLAHAGMRRLLGRSVGRDPAGLRFRIEPGGKPALADIEGLSFNLSHAGGHAALAIAAGFGVGIDLEAVRPIDDATMERALSPAERDRLRAMPSAARGQAFFRFWTRKEAVAKGAGQGLALEPAGIETGPGPAEARVCVPGHGVWRVLSVTDGGPVALPSGFALAVAAPEVAGPLTIGSLPGPDAEG